MAIITSVVASRLFNVSGRAPRGTWLATCIDNKDSLGVLRQQYGAPGVMQTVDLTAFLFEFGDAEGKVHQIATKEFRISSHEKSGLISFLRSWLGHQPPIGFNSIAMIGQKAFITIDHQSGQRNTNEVYANIVSISPVPQGVVMTTGAQAGTSSPTAPIEGVEERLHTTQVPAQAN